MPEMPSHLGKDGQDLLLIRFNPLMVEMETNSTYVSVQVRGRCSVAESATRVQKSGRAPARPPTPTVGVIPDRRGLSGGGGS